jgi:hypothetical protein
MIRLKRNRLAITPVLSSLLLTVIAVAGMSIAITATYVITDGLHDNMGERFIVEDVWFSSGQVSLYLRNVGKIGIKIDAIYINNLKQSFTPIELEMDKHGWLNVTYNWNPETPYEISLVTKRGTKLVEYYFSPI